MTNHTAQSVYWLDYGLKDPGEPGFDSQRGWGFLYVTAFRPALELIASNRIGTGGSLPADEVARWVKLYIVSKVEKNRSEKSARNPSFIMRYRARPLESFYNYSNYVINSFI